MAIFITTRERATLLAGCILVGLDGVEDNEHSDAIAALVEELEGCACADGSEGVEITIMPVKKEG